MKRGTFGDTDLMFGDRELTSLDGHPITESLLLSCQ